LGSVEQHTTATRYCNALLQHTTWTKPQRWQHLMGIWERESIGQSGNTCSVQESVLQHSIATYPCTTLLQHTTATCYYSKGIGEVATVAVYRGVYYITLLQHTTTTHYCNTPLQHTTATHYCNTQLPQEHRQSGSSCDELNHTGRQATLAPDALADCAPIGACVYAMCV